jgi:hypothetical protein
MFFVRRSIALLLLPAAVYAGPVETNVRVSGMSWSTVHGTDFLPAVYGSSSSTTRDQLYRIRGYLSVESNTLRPGDPRGAAIAEFISALQTRGVRMRVTGNVETVYRPDKTMLFLTPKAFEITEKSDTYLSLGEVTGHYEPTVNASPMFDLAATSDENDGLRFFIANFGDIFAAAPEWKCETAVFSPGFPLTRKDKLTVSGDITAKCDGAIAELHLEFRRMAGGSVVLNLVIRRMVSGKEDGRLSFDLHAIRKT